MINIVFFFNSGCFLRQKCSESGMDSCAFSLFSNKSLGKLTELVERGEGICYNTLSDRLTQLLGGCFWRMFLCRKYHREF